MTQDLPQCVHKYSNQFVLNTYVDNQTPERVFAAAH